jgi:spore germination cell wall hydrolase CwlJ-like protein
MWGNGAKEKTMPAKGIFKRIFCKNAKPVNAQRVVIYDTQKRAKNSEASAEKAGFEAIDFSDLYEETGLEETPAADFTLERPQRHEKSRAKKSKQQSTEITPASAIGYRSIQSKNNKKSFSGLMGSVFSMFKREPQTSNSSALEFAENKKRLSRKGRKNKRVLIYSGTGLLVAAILLLVVLVPGGAAAPAGASKTPEDFGAAMQSPAYVANQSKDILSPEISTAISALPPITPTATPVVTATPEPTTIETTAPDITPPPINIDKEVESFKVEAERYYNEMGYSTNRYNYTDEEFYMLAQVIHAEARGEGTKGKLAVGNVVMNRVLNRGQFGNTIKAVVTAPSQFAYNANTKPGVAAKIAARQVLDYEVWVIPQDIYFFRAVYKFKHLEGQAWGSHKYYEKIGGHYFYRHSYAGRARGGGIPPSMYSRTYKWPAMGCKPEARVYRLQWMLNKLGYKVKADKYFGEDTKESIKQFQKKKGLKVDGLAGPATLKALIKEFGLKEYYLKFCT